MLEKLRQNEDIRHKGDEARVKRNLNKLKNRLNRDELARGEEMIRARKAREAEVAARRVREARKARDAAQAARVAKKGKDAARIARDARKVKNAAEVIKRGKQIAKVGKIAGRAAIGATGIGLVVVAGSLIVEGLAGDSAEDMIIDSAYALLAEGKSLNEVGAILGKRLDIQTIAKNIEKNLQQTGKDIEGTVKDIQTGQFLPKAGQKIDQAGKDIGNFFNGIFGGKK
ncbi:MAG: hypothetical protein L0229_12245 [Blastocatellia bacterium]|nr:hypothetical protein [Blastocatellia bacterium]